MSPKKTANDITASTSMFSLRHYLRNLSGKASRFLRRLRPEVGHDEGGVEADSPHKAEAPVGPLPRAYYHADLSDPPYGGPIPKRVPASEANLVSSLLMDAGSPLLDPDSGQRMHAPALDLDAIPIRIVESSTPGHCHLYFDMPIQEDDYFTLLLAMARCGLLERGYVEASALRGFTALRITPDKHGEARKPNAMIIDHSGMTIINGAQQHLKQQQAFLSEVDELSHILEGG